MTRETWPRRLAPIEPAGTALLVIDVQKGIFHPGAAATRPWKSSASGQPYPVIPRKALFTFFLTSRSNDI